MSNPRSLTAGAGNHLSAATKDDWEDWEDDEVLTPMTTMGGSTPQPLPAKFEASSGEETLTIPGRKVSQRAPSSLGRQSMRGLRRLKSRNRQKAQNAQAGIKVVTDMSKFQQQQKNQHIAHQLRSATDTRTGKFVDVAALKALEGAPSDDSIGTFAWFRRKSTKGKRVQKLVTEVSPQADLSPASRPIVIGFAMPSDSDVVISPQTAVVETPVEFPRYFKPTKVTSPDQPVSAWSPDTEDGASPRIVDRGFVPAVPSIPSYYKTTEFSPVPESSHNAGFSTTKEKKGRRDTIATPVYDDDDDMATPITLFEEDGSPAVTQRKSLRIKGRPRAATNGSSRSQGWWDHVTSPFGPPTPQSPAVSHHTKVEENQKWWKDVDKKQSPLTSAAATSPLSPEAGPSNKLRAVPTIQPQTPTIVIQDMSTTQPSSSRAPPPAPLHPGMTQRSEKPRAMVVEEEEVRASSEMPPPYSPPSNSKAPPNARYRAVFPPGHPLNAAFPPSPGPVPPGLSHTMTSQGAIGLSDVPLTPAETQQSRAILPDRPLGSFIPGDHYIDVSGRGVRQKTERQRRRHEKEDVVAYKAGRMWHGRGCFPCCGSCFGRPGREGRKRRRWCLGICITILILTGVGVALGIILTRHTAVAVEEIPSRFLNLTNFPPMPTGISTVIGPDSDATTACVQPPTLWSCSLPKEQAESAAPFGADQPSFVLQIQFDNNSRQLWNVNGDRPRPTDPENRGNGEPLTNRTKQATATATTHARGEVPVTGFISLVRRLLLGPRESNLGFRSEPAPPSFQEMFFLGNTTDGVVSDDKAGEPTPFYISILHSVNASIGPNVLTRRATKNDHGNEPIQTNLTANRGGVNASDIAPPPALNSDGTGAPAVLLPFPTQQPVRLYDRGLPTERYSFYTYFNKTMYVKSVDVLLGDGMDSSPVPADENGGSLETEAKFLVTWLSVRYKVEIWTRWENTTRLVGTTSDSNTNNGNTNSKTPDQQPGTFPYPITITLDTHGGERGKKFAFVRGVDDRQRIIMNDARFVLNRMNTTGDLVNSSGEDFNPSLGGMDGGTGGCQCQYRNWVGVSRSCCLHYRQVSKASTNRSTRTKPLFTLAIETSCDDTCVAILEKRGDTAKLLFNEKITSDNREFGGVEPITTIKSHVANIGPLVNKAVLALPETSSTAFGIRYVDPVTKSVSYRRKPDFVSVTRGPGMSSPLSIGLSTAKGLAAAWQVPLLAVNHMQAHALTPRLVEALKNGEKASASASASETEPAKPAGKKPKKKPQQKPEFPFLSLLLSGGHTMLVLTRSAVSHSILAEAKGTTAIGDMLDKLARTILPEPTIKDSKNVMYGALLESFAFDLPDPSPSSDSNSDSNNPNSNTPTSNPTSNPPPEFTEAEYNYIYEPPAKRADEIAPYISPTYGWQLTPPLHETRAMKYNLSGLHGQAKNIMLQKFIVDVPERRELARETMRLAFHHVANRVVFALDRFAGGPQSQKRPQTKRPDVPRTLVVSGGVASNRFLMHVVAKVLASRGYGPDVVKVVRPPPQLCTDNAAMIAWTAMEMWEAGWRSELSVLAEKTWSIDRGGDDSESWSLELREDEKEGRQTKGMMAREGWYRVDGDQQRIEGDSSRG
ncbi:uncharacterized protein C8A04DRAFT_37612 [Dichotomopilus funicola]|uniref:N(6)-L-threonylcarbamoyladenine synthase n=1 Tax=Dichotomopilus funicola TaxID=1934379 RepID=A0AAN6V490_9PEZI|nr:hypothetical protein C8A04DRAFT_37612 [Dichotomopilus funicola]